MEFKIIRLFKNFFIPNYISWVLNTLLQLQYAHLHYSFAIQTLLWNQRTYMHGETNADGVNFYYHYNLPPPALSCKIVSVLEKKNWQDLIMQFTAILATIEVRELNVTFFKICSLGIIEYNFICIITE